MRSHRWPHYTSSNVLKPTLLSPGMCVGISSPPSIVMMEMRDFPRLVLFLLVYIGTSLECTPTSAYTNYQLRSSMISHCYISHVRVVIILLISSLCDKSFLITEVTKYATLLHWNTECCCHSKSPLHACIHT